MSFPLLLARKMYAAQRRTRGVSRPSIRIATVGIAVGLAIMIASVAVVIGFKHTIRDKVIGFGSHIVVADFLTLQDGDAYPIQMNDSVLRALRAVPGVRHVQTFTTTQGILKTDDDFLGVLFKGVTADYDTLFLHRSLVAGRLPHFAAPDGANEILLSSKIAGLLRVKSGDKIFAYFIHAGSAKARRFHITGIYETNLAQYDNTLCYAAAATARKINGWEADQATGAELTVSDFDRLDAVAATVAERVNHTTDTYGATYASQSVRQMNTQIFSWLDLLDLNVWIILALMVAVACVTMISGLLIIILERTQMIGLLKSLGATSRTLRHAFLWFALMIVGRGLVWGNVAGLGLVFLQKWFGLVRLDPATYYVAEVPVEVHWLLVLALNAATALICLLALIVPTFVVSHIHPAKAMKYE